MAYEVFDSTDMMSELFGKCQGITHQTGDPLPQRVIETLDMIGFPGLLCDGFVLGSRNHPFVDNILIGREHRLLAGHHREIGPSLFRTVVTAIADVERHDLPRLLVHGDPDPWLIGLLLHETPHLIGFNLQTSNEHIPWGRYGPHM